MQNIPQKKSSFLFKNHFDQLLIPEMMIVEKHDKNKYGLKFFINLGFKNIVWDKFLSDSK